MAQYREIIYESRGNVSLITLNRPGRLNALTHTTHLELSRAISEAEADENIRVIILTGAGRGFCAGDDIKDIFLAPESGEVKRGILTKLEGNFRPGGHNLLEINKPVIAAVNGAAVGYGCDLALMCHIRIASELATFGEVFVRMGLIPDHSLMLLPRLVGPAKAHELMLTGDIIDAKEAERIGLVNRVVSHDRLMEEALALAGKIAAQPPLAVRLTMEGIRRGLKMPVEEFNSWQPLAFDFCAITDDHHEAARAFTEKRKPEFKGT